MKSADWKFLTLCFRGHCCEFVTGRCVSLQRDSTASPPRPKLLITDSPRSPVCMYVSPHSIPFRSPRLSFFSGAVTSLGAQNQSRFPALPAAAVPLLPSPIYGRRKRISSYFNDGHKEYNAQQHYSLGAQKKGYTCENVERLDEKPTTTAKWAANTLKERRYQISTQLG